MLATGYRLARAQFGTPTIDGTISSGEYGNHTDGQNQQTNGSQTWYMTWDDNNLYVGISGANLGEGAIIYLDQNPLAPINGGANSDGTLVGFDYDSTNFAALQFRADLVLYVKSSYREYRTANGANGWSDATSGFGSYADNSGTNTREFSLPWSAIGGRPASFAWFGYLTSADGYVYAPVPTENPGDRIGTAARYARYYIVNSTADGASTKPFSRNSYVFNSSSDIGNWGALDVYDFTMNTAGRTLTRAGGAWTIAGAMRVDSGSVNFGAVTDGATVSGNVAVGSGGSLSLSSAVGGDLAVGGDWSNTGAFNCNGRLVTFNGTAAQTINGNTTFDYFKIANASAAGVTLAGNITVKKEFRIDTNGRLNAGYATLTLEGSSSAAVDWWNYGTFNADTSTVVFRGANNKNARVLGSAATSFNHVTISPLDTTSFGIDFYDEDYPAARATINGTLALNQYSFIADEEVGSSNGNTNLNGTPFYGPASTLKYNNSGNFDSAAEWKTGGVCGTAGTPYNVLIANKTTVNLTAAYTNSGNPAQSYPAGSNKTACGTITIESGSTLQSTAGTLTVKNDWTNNGSFTHNKGTVQFNGTSFQSGGAQTVSGNTTFYNLTLDLQSGVTAHFGSTTTTIANNLTKNAGTMHPGTGKFIFTGSPSSILGSGAKYFYDLEIASGTTNHTSGGSIRLWHSFTNNGTFTQGASQDTYFEGGTTINLAGSGSTTFGTSLVQSSSTLNAGSHNFRVVGDRFAVFGGNAFNGGAATVSFANASGTALNPTLDNLGSYNFNNLAIESDAVVLGPTKGSKTINVAGNWTNNGTFTPHESKVVFDGSAAQTLGGSSSTTFYDLVINNSIGVTLDNHTAVNHTLTLNNGRLALGTYNLAMGSAATAVGGTLGTSNMVVADSTGKMCKSYNAAGSFTFPIGDATNTPDYSPATLDFTSGSFDSGQACVRVTDAKHPNNASPSHYLTRYWTVISSGIGDFSCSTTFSYVDDDIVGTESDIYGVKWDSSWTVGPAVKAESNTIEWTLTGFSDITGSNNPTAVTLARFEARAKGHAIHLEWETASELGTAGFNLYRSTAPHGEYHKLNAALIPPQQPGGLVGATYVWTDTNVLPGLTYYYRLEDVDTEGGSGWHGPAQASLPRSLRIYLPLILK